MAKSGGGLAIEGIRARRLFVRILNMADTAPTDAIVDRTDQVDDAMGFAVDVARIAADGKTENVCVLDLRGQIVPVVDLRLRFNLAHAEYTPTTVTIVISVRMCEGTEVVGVVVDGVDDVLSINVDEVRPPPKLGGNQTKTRFMLGMVKSDDAMVMLLDTDKLFDEETIASIEQIRE